MGLCLLHLVFVHIILRPFFTHLNALPTHLNALLYCSGVTAHSSKIYDSVTSDRSLAVTI